MGTLIVNDLLKEKFNKSGLSTQYSVLSFKIPPVVLICFDYKILIIYILLIF
ncbi:hypothetical protein SAMN05216462_3156 [Xylanibacter ruminicola]|uniref:Uncharacterized protein n=1 Tax=Xylanibacter ruminicola TaxID=839 RepID=A0A1H4F677_XYLRU|nr:hypothetical protein SAMN05216462_3156 [Xylanibacter ruminicola]